MDILGQLLAGTPAPTDDYWYYPVGTLTEAGVRVDVDAAKKISAWYRGRDILATVLAMLPLQVLERLPNDGGAQPARANPLYDILHDKPNVWQDSFQWRRQKMYHLIDHGNGIDRIVPGARGFVHELRPVDPTLVTARQLESGRLLYDIRNPTTNQTTTATQDEIFHLRGASDSGLWGKGILEYARNSLGTASATESYAANIFSRGTLNGGVIENPGVLDDEAARRMATSFMRTKVGDWHLPKILEQGSTFKPNGMTPEDAQMLLSRQHTVDDIARWLGVPRMMLENNDPSFGNADQFTQNFIELNMGGWLSLWEFGINDQLVIAPRKYFAQFKRQAFVRSNFKDRVAGHVLLVNAGIETVDEAREVEDLNKRGGKADELREPQNITGKPTAADANEDPNVDTPPPTKKKPPPATKAEATDGRIRAVVSESAARLVRKEQTGMRWAAKKFIDNVEGLSAWVTTFYKDHEPLVAQTLQLDARTAQLYCDSQRDELAADGLARAEAWTTEYLVGLALDAPRPDPWQTVAEAQARQGHTIHVEAPTTIAPGAMQVHPASVTVNQPPAKPTKKKITFTKTAGDPTGAIIEET